MPSCARPQDQLLKPLASAVVAQKIQPDYASSDESLQTSGSDDTLHIK